MLFFAEIIAELIFPELQEISDNCRRSANFTEMVFPRFDFFRFSFPEISTTLKILKDLRELVESSTKERDREPRVGIVSFPGSRGASTA